MSPLLERGFLLKDVSQKLGDGRSYLRVGVRSESDNRAFVRHLTEVLSDRPSVTETLT